VTENAMFGYLLVAVALGIGQPPAAPRLEGIVVDATHGGKPLADAEVILRGGLDGTWLAVGRTVTDQNGRFTFYDLPIEPNLIYMPGVNRGGVHYPGPRILAAQVADEPAVTVTTYEAVGEPNPLTAERYDIDVSIKTGVIEVTETILICNPTATTYVGTPGVGMFATTLSLSIPGGFERVTFSDEFHGRRFHVIDNKVVTDVPWTPGKRELIFTYHLPVEQSQSSFERTLDLPCSNLRLRVHGAASAAMSCNLPRAAGADQGTTVYESTGKMLAAGHQIQLRFGSLPMPWLKYGKWAAAIILCCAVLTTVSVRRRRTVRERRKRGVPSPEPATSKC